MTYCNHDFSRPELSPDDALVLMRCALEILDHIGCSAESGAHLDLAINRLEESVLSTSHSCGQTAGLPSTTAAAG